MFSENITNSTKALLIQLMPAFLFVKNVYFLAKIVLLLEVILSKLVKFVKITDHEKVKNK